MELSLIYRQSIGGRSSGGLADIVLEVTCFQKEGEDTVMQSTRVRMTPEQFRRLYASAEAINHELAAEAEAK